MLTVYNYGIIAKSVTFGICSQSCSWDFSLSFEMTTLPGLSIALLPKIPSVLRFSPLLFQYILFYFEVIHNLIP